MRDLYATLPASLRDKGVRWSALTVGLATGVGAGSVAVPGDRPIQVVSGLVLSFVLFQTPYLLAGGLLVVGSFEDLEIPIGPATVRPAHLVAMLVALMFAVMARRRTKVRSSVTSHDYLRMATIVAALSIPSIAIQHTYASVTVLGLLEANILVMVLTTGAFVRSTKSEVWSAMKVLDVCLGGLVLAPLVQVGLALVGWYNISSVDQRLLSIGRPPGVFHEAGWTAVVVGFALLWFIARRRPLMSVLALGAVVVTAGRTPIAALLVVLGVSVFRRGRRRGWAVKLVAASLMAAAIVATPPPRPGASGSSLDTRALDQAAILRTGNAGLWGRATDNFFDESRNREVSGTSTNVLVDGYQKLGIPGVVLTVYLAYWFFRMLKRVRGDCHLAWLPLIDYSGLILAGCVINNALQRAWLWALLGIVLSVEVLGNPVRSPEEAEVVG